MEGNIGGKGKRHRGIIAKGCGGEMQALMKRYVDIGMFKLRDEYVEWRKGGGAEGGRVEERK